MLKKLHDKSRILFTVVWIIAYCLLMSVGDILSDLVGVQKSITLPIAVALSVVLLYFVKKHNLMCTYGLCKPKASSRSMLFYFPLLLMLGVNFCGGLGFDGTVADALLAVITMLFVGFLEEVIFRGFLFHALAEDNKVVAIVVSSLTFGLGHVINLFNGSGAEIGATLLQIVYATSAGFMFVMIHHTSKSLLVCLLAHGVFNSIGVFALEPSIEMQLLTASLLVAITSGYAIYLAVKAKRQNQFSN
ncbi:MAG: CPBP family intramembrane metalloprotease [Clostridia bacterium]|nr:CPBP family intramembrane metalloprotease [Clostridia bacterium]